MTITLNKIQEIFTSIKNAGDVYTTGQHNMLISNIMTNIDDSRKLWEILLNPENIGVDATTKGAVFIQNLNIIKKAVEERQLKLSDKGSNGNTPLHEAIWGLGKATDKKKITALKDVVT